MGPSHDLVSRAPRGPVVAGKRREVAASRRGVMRGALAALFAPGAVAGVAAGSRVGHPPLDWRSLSRAWKEFYQHSADVRRELDDLERALHQWSKNLHITAEFQYERKRLLRARECILDLRERFGSAFVQTIDWAAVSDWGSAISAMGGEHG